MTKLSEVWNEQLERKSIESEIISVAKFISNLNNFTTPHKFDIIEYFPIGKPTPFIPNIYSLYNLTMEIENSDVFSGDQDDKIYDDKTRVLIGFCISSIIYIGFQNGHLTITFEDGYIQIYY